MLRKLFLSIIVIGASISFVSAKEIGEFSNFRITPTETRTGYLNKYNRSNHVINLEPSRNLKMNVKATLVNSNGDDRSDVYYPTCGFRYTYSNWASPGYIYALDLARQNWWDTAAGITGSWSPDEY